jgi:hypothetical protein
MSVLLAQTGDAAQSLPSYFSLLAAPAAPLQSGPVSMQVGFSHSSHFTLKMEAVWTSEMLVSYHNPEDHNLKHHHCESLKTCK